MATLELVAYAARYGIAATVGAAGDGPVVVASIGDLRAAGSAGRSRVALMEHGAGQSYGGDRRSADHPSYAGGVGRKAQLFLHPGPHPAARDHAAYPRARVEVVGCPKLDTLPTRGPGDGPVLAFGFHWDDSRTVDEVRSGFIFFREGLELLARKYKVLGHGHPRIIDRLAPWYERKGIEVVRDFSEVCARADLYGCDNSSTLFEFAATGRPVVVLNASLYRHSVNHGLRFWEAADVGVQCARAIDLPEAVEDALSDDAGKQSRREQALALVYGYRQGAAARAAGVLLDWAAA